MTSRFPTPAEMAAWPEPNYVDPETYRPLVLAVDIPMTVIVISFVAMRFYSRTVLIFAIGFDDWLMLFAAVLSVANNIMICISTLPNYQTGYHLWDIKPATLFGTMKIAQMGMATQLLFIVITTITKTSILITYLRIFPSKLNKWFCWGMLSYTIAWGIATFFLVLFQCSPPQTYWQIFKYFFKAKCLNVKAIYYISTAQSMISDFLIFLWPVKDLWSVKISFRQRITLVCMFSAGVLICIAGLVRMYYVHVYLHSYDIFWHAAENYVIMAAESGMGIACGCLPGCKPLMSRLFPRVFGTSALASEPRRSKRKEAVELSPWGSGASVPQSRTGRSQSFGIQSLQSGGNGTILKQEEYRVEWERELERQRNSASSKMMNFSARHSIGMGPDGVAAEGYSESHSSQELIILQGTAADEEYRRRVEKNM